MKIKISRPDFENSAKIQDLKTLRATVADNLKVAQELHNRMIGEGDSKKAETIEQEVSWKSSEVDAKKKELEDNGFVVKMMGDSEVEPVDEIDIAQLTEEQHLISAAHKALDATNYERAWSITEILTMHYKR